MRLSIVIKLCIPIRHARFIFSVLYTDKCTVNQKKINKQMEQQIVSYFKQVQFDFHLLCCSYKGWSLHSARKLTIILGLSLTPNHFHTIFSILQIAYFFLPLTPIIWSHPSTCLISSIFKSFQCKVSRQEPRATVQEASPFK